MEEIRDKVILTDVDGVLFDWQFHFYQHCRKELGLERLTSEYDVSNSLGLGSRKKGSLIVRNFNKSEAMKSLSPFKDAIKYVRKLHEEHGYIFHVITSQTHDNLAKEYRKQNLINTFGNVFEGFTILNTGQDKDKELSKWEGTECWWIDDKEANIKMGNQFGLRGLLMAHEHNMDCFDEERVKSWKEIYDIITGEK
ncbi:MAG: hypothetical protein CMD98_06960 [Gammaproteobacteria bacterium]|nr:hypothetical protein [Gammaproteobacteria bacterium]|tara:strand:+ start:53698 stop:54285 length:588 start_codon:yes stop_codon:yes gene_type:complete